VGLVANLSLLANLAVRGGTGCEKREGQEVDPGRSPARVWSRLDVGHDALPQCRLVTARPSTPARPLPLSWPPRGSRVITVAVRRHTTRERATAGTVAEHA